MNKQVQHFRGLSVPITEYEDDKDEFIENTDCENVNYLVFIMFVHTLNLVDKTEKD